MILDVRFANRPPKLSFTSPVELSANFAGLLYVLFSIPGFFSIICVPSKLIVHGSAAATANNISASETLFRLGIAAQLVCQGGFIFVDLALYDLLNVVNRRHALLWVILVVVAIPVGFLNEVNSIAARRRRENAYRAGMRGLLGSCGASRALLGADAGGRCPGAIPRQHPAAWENRLCGSTFDLPQ